MKIESIKEKLAEAISLAEKITSKNATLPILKCVVLDVVSNSLTIKATNLDLGIEIKIPVKAEETGAVAIPGNILNSFIALFRF